MTRIKLSICIATLNRASMIGETLNSIITQAFDEVEIVVLDGGSTDSTTQVVRQYQQKFSQLMYFRQDAPNGVDKDFCLAVESARGDYCWLMSDDDILKPGAIDRVLHEIKKDFGLIVVNSEVRDVELSCVLEDKIIKFDSDHIYSSRDSEKFFIDSAGYLSFIGCVVIKRDIWLTREKEKYFGTLFVHVGVIFQQPIFEDILLINDPLIAIRGGNAQWTLKSFEIWFFKWPKLIWSFAHFSNAAKNKVYPEKPFKEKAKLLSARAGNSYSWDVYRKLINPVLHSSQEKFFPFLIAIFPGFLVNFIGIVYFSLIRKSSLSLYYLKNSHFYYKQYFKFKR